MEQYKEILYPLVSHANALMTISHENPILRDFWRGITNSWEPSTSPASESPFGDDQFLGNIRGDILSTSWIPVMILPPQVLLSGQITNRFPSLIALKGILFCETVGGLCSGSEGFKIYEGRLQSGSISRYPKKNSLTKQMKWPYYEHTRIFIL